MFYKHKIYAQGGVLSLSDSIRGRNFTVFNVVHEKNQCSQKTDPKYVVTVLKNKIGICHSILLLFKKPKFLK